jgi:hypothetical protein
MTAKIFEEMPQEPKSRWCCCTVLIQPPIHKFPVVLFFGFLQWIQHIFLRITNQTRNHSYYQAASSCRHRTYNSLAQSLRAVGFSCGLVERAERVGFGTTTEYFAKLQDVLKLSSDKSR